jgi:hypothetical protein
LDDQIYLNEITCGEIKKERGIQRLEAMLFAIDLINNSTELLPNLRIGAKIYDTCDRDTIALDKCLKFVSDHFLINDAEIVNDFSCPLTNEYTKHFYNGAFNSIDNNNNNNQKQQATSVSTLVPQKNEDRIYKRKIAGVIGAASSSVSIQVANLLRLFQVRSSVTAVVKHSCLHVVFDHAVSYLASSLAVLVAADALPLKPS